MLTASYLLLVLLWARVNCQDRGDVLPEIETDGDFRVPSAEAQCSCSSKVAGAIILTIIVMLIIQAVSWCVYKHKRKGYGSGKVDPEAAGRAAYDNPQFQGDELDSCGDPPGRESHQVSCVSTSSPSGGGGPPPAKLASTATNTTSTLERGKTTLERVMAAVIASGRSFSPKKTKDDSFLSEPRIVAVPLQAHDFTGLGFTVHGNLRNGIFVKDVQSRGPATESKQVAAGDRVAALTVFFDHMVYDDACTILSYALPYPVLLHLEKSQNPSQFPVLVATPPKGKKIPPSPSTKLLHPIFRSQSHSELVKISSMDLKNLRLGNIVSPKNKGISPLTIGVELPKMTPDQFAQRCTESRHSERAIDVPGVEIKAKLPSSEVNLDGADIEKTGLANVQVHRPMSPTVGIDMPEEKIIIKACQEAPLTDIKETIPGPKLSKNDSKLKFGVRVLPDLGFQKNVSKDIDLKVGMKGGIDSPDAGHLNTGIQVEKGLAVKNEKGLKFPDLGFNAKLPKISGEAKDKSIKEPSVSIEIPEPEIEITNENEKEKGKARGKFGFGFGALDFKKNSEDSREEENKKKPETTNEKSNSDFGINIDGPNWKAPSLDLKFKHKDKSSPKIDKSSNLDKKLNIEATSIDIAVPKSSEIKLESELNLDKKADSKESKGEAEKSKESIDIKLTKPDIGLPSFHFKKDKNSEVDKYGEHDSDKEKQKHKVRRKGSSSDGDSSGFGISLKRPDIKFPSFDLRQGKSKDEDEGEKESEDEKMEKKERKKSKDKSGFNFKFKTPDFSFPTFGGKDEKLPGAEIETGKMELKPGSVEVEIPKVQMEKQKEMPDIDIPEKGIDLSIKMPDFVSNIQEIKATDDGNKPEHGIKDSTLKVDLSLPEVSLPDLDIKNKVDINEIDVDGTAKLEHGAPSLDIDTADLVEAVNIDAKLPELQGEVKLSDPTENIKVSLPELETNDKHNKESSKWKLDLRAPDISLPSFNIKKKESDKDITKEISSREELKITLAKPVVSIPGAEISTDDKADKKKFKFGMKLPDVALPSFGFDGDKKGDTEASCPELMKAEVNLNADLNTHIASLSDNKVSRKSSSEEAVSTDIKGNLSADLKGPDNNLTKPKLLNKETVVVNLNVGEKTQVDFIPPDVTALRTKFSEGTKDQKCEKTESEEEAKEPHEDEEISNNKKSKKKKGFGFKIKAPDFEMPDFKLKHGHKQYSLDESDAGINVKNQANVSKTVSLEGKYTDASAKIDANQPIEKHTSELGKDDTKKKKGFGFSIKMPDITLPDFKFKSGDKNNEELSGDISHDTSSMDKIKIEGKLPEMDLVVENENNENVSKDREVEESKKTLKLDAELPQPEVRLENISKEIDVTTEDEIDSHSKLGLSIKMPNFSLPGIALSSKKKEKGEDIKDHSPVPNEEENGTNSLEDDLNATDATKKKRFGIKFNQPNIKLPQLNTGEGKHVSLENYERNQSDEMKSLHLKLKSPSAVQPELSANTEAPNKGKESSVVQKVDCNIDASEPKFSLSDALKTEANLIVCLSDDDLQKKSDEWKIKEMSDTSKVVEYTIPSLAEASVENDLAIEGAKDSSFKIKLPDFKTDIHTSNDKHSRTTKEIFGVKLRSPKISSIEYEIDGAAGKVNNAEVNKGIQPEVKVSTASLELSTSNLASKVKSPFSMKAENDSVRSKLSSSDVEVVTNSKINLPYIEIESDLPEADSDLKIKSIDLPEVDISMPKVDLPNLTNESEYTFKVSGENDDPMREMERQNFKFMKSEIPTNEASTNQIITSILNENDSKDLPEVDIDMSTRAVDKKVDVSLNPPNFTIPEGSIEYSISRSGKVEKEKKEQRALDYSSDSESDDEKPKKVGVDLDMKIKKNDEQKVLMSTKHKKDSDEEDKAKSKGKLALGFGFKGFGRSSDSEDTEADNRTSSDPNSTEAKDKKLFGGKMSFGIKSFGRSSSDTEEENSDIRVSGTPMQKDSEKNATKPKNLGFGFKAKMNKSSDSEEPIENEKIETDPEAEVFIKKRKAKVAPKPDEETKSRTKTFSFTSKSSKDSKSESEIGEEEKSSLEARDDQKGKHKYGLGFGFRKNSGKSASDSEGGEYDEKKVSMDAKGVSEKSKDSKSKSLKLGFKPFKNLKGRIQTEINKMRHDSSDEEVPLRLEESHNQGEKRKKISKKKEKDKKVKQAGYLDLEISDEAAMSSAAMAAKENRRKRLSRSSSSSSSESSSDVDGDNKHVEKKKKKKSKGKRKEEGRMVTTGVIEVEIPEKKEAMEVDEHIQSSQRQLILPVPTFADGEEEENSKLPVDKQTIHLWTESSDKEGKAVVTSVEEKTPKRYVVVKEMKLKHSTPSIELTDVNEVVEKVTVDKTIPPVLLMEERGNQVYTDTDGGSWGSDSDFERMQKSDVHVSLSETSVNLSVPGCQKMITDSEELKRRAASLGDLSRIHEGVEVGNLLERAVSLDLKTASEGPPNLHVRRLRLPDSSATSIDEVDEALALPSPKKLDASVSLKAASRWGTLEDALLLERAGVEYQDIDIANADGSLIKTSNGEGVPISNIEISGGKGSSVTALSSGRGSWNESFDEETPPALPTSPVPHGTTTITVTDDLSNSSISDQNSSDASIVIVPREHSSNGLINFNVQSHSLTSSHLPPLESKMSIPLMQDTFDMNEINSKIYKTVQEDDSVGISYAPRLQFLNDIEEQYKISDAESHLQMLSDRDDSGGVTITMIPAEDHSFMNVTSVNTNPPPVPPKPKGGKTFTASPDILSYDSGVQTQLVTVNHDWIKENGDILKESDHNLSDEYLTPESSPQKSMTQITLDGDGVSGYTVTEGTFSRTVIISNPDSSNPVSIVQTDGESSSLPMLQNRHD